MGVLIKLVSDHGDGVLRSALISPLSAYSLTYEVGVETEALPGTLLFAFEDLDAAQAAANGILRVPLIALNVTVNDTDIVSNPSHAVSLSQQWNGFEETDAEIASYWTTGVASLNWQGAIPAGTVVVPRMTPGSINGLLVRPQF